MDLFLAIGVLVAIVAWLAVVIYKASSKDRNLNVFCGLVGGIVLPLVFYNAMFNAVGLGKLATLRTNTAYEVSGVHESTVKDKATKTVVLELRTSLTDTNDRYFYLVYCSSLLGSCPDVWPKRFTAVKDGELLIIVPLKAVAEN